MLYEEDTIVAQATPPGRGGIAIIRISGKKSLAIAKHLYLKEKASFNNRQAMFVNCYSLENKIHTIIDEGISIYFKSPNSFTGEDVIEFQCHGNPVVVDRIIKEALKKGARLAKPGEFSERAFLNGKIDLVQAEAIADLIDSQSNQAARNALQTLKGVFSEKINNINQQLIQTRMYLEAAIDFPDEEGVDFISEGKIKEKIQAINESLTIIQKEAEQGQLLQEGMSVVLSGEPNAGKSSLLNCLSYKDSAIVTDIAGTTRDVLKESIFVEGLPLNIIDTAGLRESEDPIEQEGIRRAWLEIENADLILYLVESSKIDKLENQQSWKALLEKNRANGGKQNILILENKIDLDNKQSKQQTIMLSEQKHQKITISAKYNQGINILKKTITDIAGLSIHEEGKFSARRRHIQALYNAQKYLIQALSQFFDNNQTGFIAAELVAEDLRLAHQCLSEITGEFSSDDLLGEIFSGFCIGK